MHPDIPPPIQLIADWMPVFVLLALVLVAVVTWLLCGEYARHLARIVTRQDHTIRELEERLAETETLVDRLTDGADDILKAARGAHHRADEVEPSDRD